MAVRRGAKRECILSGLWGEISEWLVACMVYCIVYDGSLRQSLARDVWHEGKGSKNEESETKNRDTHSCSSSSMKVYLARVMSFHSHA